MKKLLFICSLLFVPLESEAHAKRMHLRHHPVVTKKTTLYHWVYVSEGFVNGVWVSGHWKKVTGPHPYANHPEWYFVKGKHVIINGHRVWVPGHWTHKKVIHTHPRRRYLVLP